MLLPVGFSLKNSRLCYASRLRLGSFVARDKLSNVNLGFINLGLMKSDDMSSAGAERRKEDRIPFVAKVTVYSGSDEKEWRAQDLSLQGGGMFVAAQRLLTRGEEVEVGFYLPGYDLEIITEASVAWINDPPADVADPSKPRGMGLEFKDLEPEYHKVLLEYVAQRHQMDADLELLEAEVGAPVSVSVPAPAPERQVEFVAPTLRVEPRAVPLPESSLPAVPAPESKLPAMPPLESKLPVVTLPQAKVSAAPVPQAKLPAAPVPQAKLPTAPVPQAKPPAAPVPQAKLPAAPVPQTKLPAAPVPQAELPAAPVPQAELPAAPVPQAELPMLDLGKELSEDLAAVVNEATLERDLLDIDGIGESAADASLINDLIADSLAELEPETESIGSPFAQQQGRESPVALDQAVLENAGAEERLDAGQVLGSYRIVKWLGSGGMGDVYLAEHTQLGRKVAIKRLRSEYAKNSRALQRFFDEARAVNRIQHDNIVQITDFSGEGEHVYCVMEFLEGKTLAQLQLDKKIIPLEQALRIATQVCEALDVVHKAGVIHRDLKPQNIMLIEQGGSSDFVKLLDFGVAKLKNPEGEASLESTGSTLLGTPGYMSPEQLLGNPVDHRADIYALGVILYQMTTGTNPFVADTWGQAVVKHATHVPPKPNELGGPAPRLPNQLESLILRCLEKDPDQRPQTVAEVALSLRQLAGVAAVGGNLNALSAGVPRKSRLPMVAGLVVGLGSVAAAGVFFAPQVPWLADKLPWLQQPAGLNQTEVALATAIEKAPEVGATAANDAKRAIAPSMDSDAVDPASAVAVPEDADASESDKGKTTPTKRRLGREPTVREPTRDLSPSNPKPEYKETPVPPSKPEPAPQPVPEPPKSEPPKAKAPAPAPAPVPTPASTPDAAADSGADGHYTTGVGLLKQNKAVLAVEEFNKAIGINPKHIKSYKMMGKAYILLGREEKAIEAFEKFVSLAPNHKDTPKLSEIIEQYRNR